MVREMRMELEMIRAMTMMMVIVVDDHKDVDDDDWRARFARMQIARDFDCEAFTCNYEEEQALERARERVNERRKRRARANTMAYRSSPDITNCVYSDISDAE